MHPSQLQLLFALAFAIIGLSHILQPRAWTDFFKILAGKGHAGVFINGFLTLVPGVLIVTMHNVWTWPGVVLTVIGWLHIAKSAVCFLFPAVGLKSLQLATDDKAHRFRIAGVLLLFVGAFLLYCALA